MQYYSIFIAFLIVLNVDGEDQILSDSDCVCVESEDCGDEIQIIFRRFECAESSKVCCSIEKLRLKTECVCVRRNECGNQTNEFVINFRHPPECDNYLQTCCDPKYIQPDFSSPNETSESCGHTNQEGVVIKIVGNTDHESQFGEFPWMIAVLVRGPKSNNKFIYQNGGSLIHPKVVLTTAGRVSNKSLNEIQIRAGEWDRKTFNEPLRHVDRNVSEILIYPDYRKALEGNNIALLILDRPFELARHINTISLPPQNYQIDFNDCLVSGWGETKLLRSGNYANILKKRRVTSVSTDICTEKYKRATRNRELYIHESYICAGDASNDAICEGDGGSPLVCAIPGVENKYNQVGIVAMGLPCKQKNVPTMYTKVSLYKNWIDEKLNERNLELCI